MDNPQLYGGIRFENPILLDTEFHSDIGIDTKRVNRSISVANYCQINVEEFADARSAFPIVFSISDPYMPIAVFGIVKGHNTYANGEGGWLSTTYEPLAIRQYPFCAAPQEASNIPVAFDQVMSLQKGGVPLFEDDGASDYLTTKLTACKQYLEGQRTTAKFIDLMKKHGLFRQIDQKLQSADQVVDLGQFQIVDINRVERLDEHDRDHLNTSGAMAAITYHLESLSQFQTLVDAIPAQ